MLVYCIALLLEMLCSFLWRDHAFLLNLHAVPLWNLKLLEMFILRFVVMLQL